MRRGLYILLFISCIAFAGGGAGIKTKKILFEEGAFTNYTLKVRVYENGMGDWYQECQVLTIQGHYSFWRWKIQRRTRPTYQEHKNAIAAIKSAQGYIYFNGVGNVFKKTSERCVVESEGLDLEKTSEKGHIFLNSYYDYHP